MADNVNVKVIIHGRVQGVFFRKETQMEAHRIGVTGWVRNKADGSVEALFEGTRQNVETMLEWCETGPPLSHVTDVNVSWGEYTGKYDGFDIRF